MTRTSNDEIREGRVYNGFDYQLQVWVHEGMIERCAHPASMREGGRCCCDQHRYAGRSIYEIEGAEEFSPKRHLRIEPVYEDAGARP